MGCRFPRLAVVAVLISCLCAGAARAADVQAGFDFPSSTLTLAVDDPNNSGARFVVAGFPLLGAAVIGFGNTTVNGGSFEFFLAPLDTLTGNLNIDCTLTNQNDAATFVFILGNRLNFQLGGGNDTFALVFGDAAELMIDGGDGADSALILATADSQNITAVEDLFPFFRTSRAFNR